MDKESNTTITLPKDLVAELHTRKAYGESYADVIRRLISLDVGAVKPAEQPRDTKAIK